MLPEGDEAVKRDILPVSWRFGRGTGALARGGALVGLAVESESICNQALTQILPSKSAMITKSGWTVFCSPALANVEEGSIAH